MKYGYIQISHKNTISKMTETEQGRKETFKNLLTFCFTTFEGISVP